MINISEKEFLNYLERYANKEISMTQLTNELESNYRTINNKIIEMSIDNPNLYYRIIINHPYKQKTRTDIDFEALMIYILKQGITIEQATNIFNISRRTIQRRVDEMKDTNHELYRLFKGVVGREAKKTISPELQAKIEGLDLKPVVLGEINEEREKFLESKEKRFNDLVGSGLTHEQAAKQMGYSNNYVRKILNELYRIRIERNVKQQAKSSNEFRDGLSDMSQYSSEPVDNISNVVNRKIEDRNNEAR